MTYDDYINLKGKEKQMMTRKHYVAIAAAVKASDAGNAASPAFLAHPMDEGALYWRGYANARQHLLKSVVEVLAADNPNFDREKFLDACGNL